MMISTLVSPHEAASAIGRSLKAHRLAQNMTQQALAARAGISVQTVKRMEATGAGSIQHLLLIAWTLGFEKAFADLIPKPAPARIEELIAPKPRQRASAQKRVG